MAKNGHHPTNTQKVTSVGTGIEKAEPARIGDESVKSGSSSESSSATRYKVIHSYSATGELPSSLHTPESVMKTLGYKCLVQPCS